MKLRKFSLIMAVIMIITCLPISGLASSNAQDVEFQEMLGTLKALDIIVDTAENPFNPDGSVNRADMVVMAAKLLGVNTVGVSEQFDTFYDVPPEHEAYNEIIMAYNMGIISGVDHERFDPQGIVTYEQAVKILVSVLGYDTVAQQMGGYPEGYLAVGIKTGLLDKITAKNNLALTYSDVVKMIFNALEVDMFDASYYLSGGGMVEQVQEGKTLLEEKFDVKTIRGTVTQNGVTSLNSNQTSSKERVLINGEYYFVGNTNIAAYLGYNVKVYYKGDGDLKEVIFFSEIDKHNNVLTLTDKDEVALSYSGGKFTVGYEQNNRRRTEIVQDAACIYNGVFVDAANIEGENGMMTALAGKSLSVKLIDNNRDNSYDVIVIGAYKSVLVNTVSTLNERITYYVYGADYTTRVEELNISEGADVEYTIYDKAGNILELKSVEPKQVISIYEDMSKKIYEIRVSTEKLKGQIFALDDSGCYSLKVVDENANTDGEAIEITFDADFQKSATLPAEFLRLGLKTTFYLDVDGNLAAFDMGSAVNGNYGLIMDCGKKFGSIGNYEFKIMTNEGNIMYLDAEKKITAYNPASGEVEKTEVSTLVGTTRDDSNPAHKFYLWFTDNASYFDQNADEPDGSTAEKQFYNRTWLSDSEKSNIASRKMVYYKTNSDGKITTILVPDIPDPKYNKLSLMNGEGRYGSYRWVSGSRLFYDDGVINTDSSVGAYIKLAEEAKIFSCVATDYNEENYNVTDIKVLRGSYNKMWFYSVDGSAEAQLVMQYSTYPREGTGSMPLVVVKSVTENRDGSYTLKGYSRGAEYEGIIAPEISLVETQLSRSSGSFTPIKQNNVLPYVSTDSGGEGNPVYDYSTNAGSTHQYADNDSIKRGDIILVGKDRREEICYVEIAMRAENGVLVFPAAYNNFKNRIKGDVYKKGVVTGFTIWGDALVSCIGYDGGTNLYYDKDMFHDFSKCKNIWIYDYSSKTMETATSHDIMLGDVVMTDGTAFAPVDCIVLRNYPVDEGFYETLTGGSSGPVEDDYTGSIAVDFYNFSNRSETDFPEEGVHKYVFAKPNSKTFSGSGYSVEVGEDNVSNGTNPIYLVKRPGSTDNDWCAMLPNVGYTDGRMQAPEAPNYKIDTHNRALKPREVKILLTNSRSADGDTKLVVEFDYFATAAATGSITLNNSEGTPFLTIDMDEEKAMLGGEEIYNYITGGGNDGFATVQITIDRTAKTADIYVDGVQKITGAALSADFTDLQSISFTQSSDDKAKQTGDVYVDNVNVYENNELHSVTPDPTAVKMYVAEESFDHFAEANANQLRSADSGVVPRSVKWHLDGNGYKSSAMASIGNDDETENKPETSDMSFVLNTEFAEGTTSLGSIYLRFPYAPLWLRSNTTNYNTVVFEWDMKYTAPLAADFMTLSMMYNTDGTLGDEEIVKTTLGYVENVDTVDKWHKVVVMIDKTTAGYKVYKVYTDGDGNQNAILAGSGVGNMYEKIDLLKISRSNSVQGADKKVYIDNLKVYEAPESLVMSEFDTVTE